MARGLRVFLAAALLGAGGPSLSVGTIAVGPRGPDGGYDAAVAPYADALTAALTERGFTMLDDPDHAAYVADLRVSRTQVGLGLARVPGQRKPAIAGTGVVLPLSTGQSDVVPLERTRLDLRIARRGQPGNAWTGAAVTVREPTARTGGATAVATDLSQALLSAYPNAPGKVIGVP